MNKTAVHAIIMVLTTILAKVLGFCRELSLAFSYGASNVSDAYVVAFTLPTILFSGLGTAMLTSYISVYTDLQQNRPGEEKPFHDQVITMSFLLSVGFIAVFLALRYPIVRLFALGFEGAQLDLTVNLSSIMIASLVFLGVGYILQGYLQMKGCFFTICWAGALSSATQGSSCWCCWWRCGGSSATTRISPSATIISVNSW